ncbi:hypothetical protein ACFV2D_04925 [Streptomyces capillispiralis]|uniref:hypothetical protein n=1 Tax=Streptomyces capillispiralis TaxID=68182 RepID=UPI00369F2F32
MTYELPDGLPDFREDVDTPLTRPRPGRRLRLVPDPQPSEAELALRQLREELEAVRARGPVIAATVASLGRAVERLDAVLGGDDR